MAATASGAPPATTTGPMRPAIINAAFSNGSFRHLCRRGRHGHRRQQQRPGAGLGHAVRHRRLSDPGRTHRPWSGRSRPSASATARLPARATSRPSSSSSRAARSWSRPTSARWCSPAPTPTPAAPRINGGTLQVASDANLGDAAGGLSLRRRHAAQHGVASASARGVTLECRRRHLRDRCRSDAVRLDQRHGRLHQDRQRGADPDRQQQLRRPNHGHGGRALSSMATRAGQPGPTSVQTGATLGGNGTSAATSRLPTAATLSPGSADGTPGTLAIAGNLDALRRLDPQLQLRPGECSLAARSTI